MNNSTALGALRRRWWVIVLLALVGAVLGALPKPARVEEASELISYSATHTLLLNNTDALNSSASTISPKQVTLFATVGEVPKRAAEEIGFRGNSAALASQVTATFDLATGALTISTVQDTAEQAELVANTFADVLVAYLAERQDLLYQERLSSYLTSLEKLEKQLTDLTAQLASNPEDAILLAQRDAISRQYSVAFELNEVLSESPPVLGFTTLQSAEAVADQQSPGGLGAPRSRTTRAVLGFVAGFGVGIGVALLMGLLDRRIRTREQAEAIMGMRARMVIPKVKSARRGLVVKAGRHDSLSDAYRTLRNVVGFVQSGLEPVDRARVTVVVSPGAGEGKTSLVANLAAAMAEAEQRAIVVNTDFRRPRLASVVTEGEGTVVPFVVEDLELVQPEWVLTESAVDNVALLDLATLSGSAGELMRATINLVPALTKQVDAIVIDTPPVGATAEVLEAVPLADLIIVVVRVGQTSIRTAQRSIEILRDVTTSPMMLVLTGLKPEGIGYYEYADRRPKDREPAAEGDAHRDSRWRRREKVG